MSKSAGGLGVVIRVVFLILLAFLALGATVLLLVLFVPIVGWFLWQDHDRLARLEKKLAAMENPKDNKPESQES